MIEDIHEPLASYESDFKKKHAKNAAELFTELLEESGVDVDANERLIKEISELKERATDSTSLNNKWKLLRWLVIIVAIISAIYIYVSFSYWWLIAVVLISVPPVLKLNRIIGDINSRVDNIEKLCNAKEDKAWRQMEDLNILYHWDMASKLIRKTVPRIEFDDFFTNARLTELHESFGLDNQFNHDNKSVIFAYSGAMNGNPFVLASTVEHWMGNKTYEGSLRISWTERVRNHDGSYSNVTRSQTLTATVTQPCPVYEYQTFVIYGNEAAPDLSFSRMPSGLSDLNDGFWSKVRKKRAAKALDKKSRDLATDFTGMSNKEFDTLFDALDRDNESQFRLLFTPLAQIEMLKLLKDKTVGYGDDFSFEKSKMLNLITPSHLQEIDISCDPRIFHHYDVTEARKNFLNYHNQLFKSFYFTLAPLLTIPLYQQHRSHKDIYKDVYDKQSCYWEHESIANFYGDEFFAHPNSATTNILKTKAITEEDGSKTIKVGAAGFATEHRTDYISVRGGDGYYHDVPVDWIEYIDVYQESEMAIKEHAFENESDDETTKPDDSWKTTFENKGIDAEHVNYRRSIFSAPLSQNSTSSPLSKKSRLP